MDSPFYVKYLLQNRFAFFISLFSLSAILKIRNREHAHYVGLVVAYTWNREKQMFVALGKEFDMNPKNPFKTNKKQETYPWTSAVSQTLRALKSAKGNAITKWDLDKEQLMLTLRQNLYEYIPRGICFWYQTLLVCYVKNVNENM